MKQSKILFLCTGNSCRSQMAEGFAKHHFKDEFEVYSAGMESHGLNPLAVKAMQEIGIDISNQRSKTLNDIGNIDFDVVITVCGDAHERCPAYLKKTKLIHKGFPDPAKAKGSEDEVFNAFRNVRDQIVSFIKNELKLSISNS